MLVRRRGSVALEQELGNYGPQVNYGLCISFCKGFCWKPATLIHLHVFYAAFVTRWEELSAYDRDCTSCKA